MMIAIWIVAAAFMAVGGLYGFPKMVKLVLCDSHIQGRIASTTMVPGVGGHSVRAVYTYTVNGVNKLKGLKNKNDTGNRHQKK